jgi:hypothetical protein
MLQYPHMQSIGEMALIPDRDRPIAVAFSDTHLHITLANGRTIPVSLDKYPALATATLAQRANFQLSLSGIHWLDLNLDVSLPDLLSPTASSPRRRKPRFCEG